MFSYIIPYPEETVHVVETARRVAYSCGNSAVWECFTKPRSRWSKPVSDWTYAHLAFETVVDSEAEAARWVSEPL